MGFGLKVMTNNVRTIFTGVSLSKRNMEKVENIGFE